MHRPIWNQQSASAFSVRTPDVPRCTSSRPTACRPTPQHRRLHRAPGCRGRPGQARAPAVVAQTVAASTSDRPIFSTSVRNARSMVSTLPASVPSPRRAADSPAVIGCPPSVPRAPGGRPRHGRAVGDRHDARRALRRDRGADERWVDVIAVANHLGRDFFALENGPGQARRAVAEGRHAIEQVGRMARPGGDCFEALLERRRRMAHRDAESARHRAIEPGRDHRRAPGPG